MSEKLRTDFLFQSVIGDPACKKDAKSHEKGNGRKNVKKSMTFIIISEIGIWLSAYLN